jgi:molybdopterin converting factor small subunit
MDAHISVKLFATLSKFTPDSSDNYPVSSGTSVRELLKILGVSEKDAKLIFINNKKGELASSLKDGDRVGIFPPIGGG